MAPTNFTACGVDQPVFVNKEGFENNDETFSPHRSQDQNESTAQPQTSNSFGYSLNELPFPMINGTLVPEIYERELQEPIGSMAGNITEEFQTAQINTTHPGSEESSLGKNDASKKGKSAKESPDKVHNVETNVPVVL